MNSDPRLPFSDSQVSNSPISDRPAQVGDSEPARKGTHTAVLEPPVSEPTQPQSGMQLWLHRISVFLFVLISAVAGVLLVILPWTPEWTDNYLLLTYPSLRTLVSAGFFRGICSGLGLLDIWIGFWEALHYHEHP